MEKEFVFINKCSSLEKALRAPRGPPVEIDGRNIVGVFRRGVTVVTKEYAEVKLVSMQRDKDSKWWSFSCPLAYASLLPSDEDNDVHGMWNISESGYLLYHGQVEHGSASALAKAIVTDNPDWFLTKFESVQSSLVKFAARQEY